MTGYLSAQERRIRRWSIFLTGALRGLWLHRRLPRNASRAESAQWLHESCARTLRAIELQVDVTGELPARGFIGESTRGKDFYCHIAVQTLVVGAR